MASGRATLSGGCDVLVVEDDVELSRLVGDYVELAGFEYVAALDGAKALAYLRRQTPRMIVLDMMLPDLTGLDICRLLKAERHTSGVPVIVLTAMHNDDSRQECLCCGAAEYLTKPFDPDQFLDVLARYAGPTIAQDIK